jgi:hypothetical protein
MADARWLVRHYVEPLSFYAWQVLAGLVTLAHAHEIDLEFTRRGPAGLPPTRAVPWAEVTDRETATTRQVCFDLADGDRLTGKRTEWADVVFKRTLTPGTVATGPRGTVLPYGLNYSCRSGAEGRLLRYSPAGVAATLHNLRHRRSRLTLARTAWPVVGPVRLYRADRHPDVLQPGIPRLVSHFEVPPTEPARAEVLFQTRAWPENVAGVADHHTPANFQRAAVIRALRRRLGARFRGGFVPTAYARQHFADCLSDQPSDPLSYLQASRRVGIMVSTEGLRGSVPYKVPEFLAGSRAIVSEAIEPRLPAPLVPGTHLESFTDPEHCADLCEQLLDAPDRVEALRHHAWDYYCDQVRPDALIRNRLADLASLG